MSPKTANTLSSDKERWDPDFAKRKIIQADLLGLTINMGGTTSIGATREGVHRACELKNECQLNDLWA